MLQDSLSTNATSLKVAWGDREPSQDATPGPRSGFFAIAVRPEAGLDIFNRYS
jgi:hypothetical protein